MHFIASACVISVDARNVENGNRTSCHCTTTVRIGVDYWNKIFQDDAWERRSFPQNYYWLDIYQLRSENESVWIVPSLIYRPAHAPWSDVIGLITCHAPARRVPPASVHSRYDELLFQYIWNKILDLKLLRLSMDHIHVRFMGFVTIIDNYSDLRDIQMRVGRYKELNLEVSTQSFYFVV